VLEEKVDAVGVEEERILSGGGKLTGSMVRRRRVLGPWAVGEAWERFSCNKTHVVERAFAAVGISLPIYGSLDAEISIKGLETSLFVEGVKGRVQGAIVGTGVVVEDHDKVGIHDEEGELDIAQDELDGQYIVGKID